MPVNIFLSGDSLTRSFSSGVRDESNLLQLQRQLRAADQEFLFRAQTDPLRAQQLGENLEASRFRNQLNRQTQEAQANTIRANALLTGAQADSARVNADILIENRDLASEALGANFRARTITDNSRGVLNAITATNAIEDRNLRVQARSRTQAINNAQIEAAGGDVSKIPQVDFVGASNNLDFSALGDAIDNFQGRNGPAARQSVQRSQQIAADIRSGGSFSQTLTAAGVTPEAQAELANALEAPTAVAGQAATELKRVREERDALQREMIQAQTALLRAQNDAEKARGQTIKAQTPPQPSAPAAAQPTAQGADPTPDNVQEVQPAPAFNPSTPPTVPGNRVPQLLEIATDDNPIGFADVADLRFEIQGEENELVFTDELAPPQVVAYTADNASGTSLPVIRHDSPHGQVFDSMLVQESRKRQFTKGGKTVLGPPTRFGRAVGIAQVLEGTAKEQAKRMGIPYSRDRLFNDANYNARIGQSYFDYLRRRYKDTTLAVAAYNAGPGNVDKWVRKYGDPRRGQISNSAWAARIPFKETRNYVQQVYGRIGR